MDDGNRQLAISLNLGTEQFEALDLKLGGINGAINKLAESIAEPDTSVAAEIISLQEVIGAGFADVRMSIENLNTAVLDMSGNIGKWLAAIALAASTPDNNSAEVQKLIDKHAADIAAQREKLQSSIDRNQPKGE